ncbi:MAG: hypothetical protein CM1200mP18_11410 [Gammaproteobacteria bacterium]|nr:MAG: hypothetical protein CM1200mP18_11410 [Gammaproteobacteria bacterium]
MFLIVMLANIISYLTYVLLMANRSVVLAESI